MSLGTRMVAVALIVLMAIGSVGLWLGVPVGWIYLASQMVESSQPTLGPYVLVLIGIPVTMVIVGKGLSKLNRTYGELTGTTPHVYIHAPWNRSMRGERDAGHPRTILDVVMVVSVALALSCLGVWFLFFAEGGGI